MDEESRYAHSPQVTILKLILMMGQLRQWDLAVPDVALAFLHTPITDSQGRTHPSQSQKGFSIQSQQSGDSSIRSMVSEIR